MTEFRRSLVKVAVGVTAFAGMANGEVLNFEHKHVADQAIVSFADDFAALHQKRLLADYDAKVLHRFDASGNVLVEFQNKGVTAHSMAQRLADHEAVELVEANTILHMDATMPNDPRFDELYGLHNDGGTGGTPGADIDAPEAWDISTGSRDVVVGVIDTGVDYTHQDIAPNYWNNPGEVGTDAEGNDKRTNGIDDDGNGYVDDWRGWDFVNDDNDPMDDHNHGTHCAGTIGGHGDDNAGVVGVNWKVSIVGLKFLSASGSGSLADAVEAIEYATDLGLDLTSNSWGGGGFSDTMDAAIREANEAGSLFIAAAGNSGANNDSNPHYPSSYEAENIIAVAATDHNDEMAGFSCYGPESVDVAAPGVDILSSVTNDGYETMSGTSMATPHVAGIAALTKSVFPDADATKIKTRILNTADPVSALDGKILTGGRVNAANALEQDSIPPNAPANLVVSEVTTTSVELSWAASGDDGADGVASRYLVRYSDQPIESEADWQNAAAGNVEVSTPRDAAVIRGTMGGLPFNATGYVAVKAVDNVGNQSAVSESVPFELLEVDAILENPAENLDRATPEGSWGIEAVSARGGNVFSDSPDGNYQNDQNASITLDPQSVDTADLTLVFETYYDIESGYDFGHVEVSTDGSSWTELDKISGSSSGWVRKSYSLADVVGNASEIIVRFRFTSDYSVTRDGWKIDNIMLFAPAGN